MTHFLYIYLCLRTTEPRICPANMKSSAIPSVNFDKSSIRLMTLSDSVPVETSGSTDVTFRTSSSPHNHDSFTNSEVEARGDSPENPDEKGPVGSFEFNITVSVVTVLWDSVTPPYWNGRPPNPKLVRKISSTSKSGGTRRNDSHARKSLFRMDILHISTKTLALLKLAKVIFPQVSSIFITIDKRTPTTSWDPAIRQFKNH